MLRAAAVSIQLVLTFHATRLVLRHLICVSAQLAKVCPTQTVEVSSRCAMGQQAGRGKTNI